MRTEPRSVQGRFAHPEAGSPGEPHPRAVEMAEAMREIAAAAGNATFRDLMRAGFTASEIAEHRPEAERLANAAATRQVAPRGDLLKDMKLKAREAVPNFMPLPRGATETQALFVAWNRYCAGRGAYALDPWGGQRERCLSQLTAYFRLTSAGEAVIAEVVEAARQAMVSPGRARSLQ